MIVKNRLQILLDERQMNQYQLFQLTGIAYHVLGAHMRNEAKRVDYKTLEKVCEALNCDVKDFFTTEGAEDSLPPLDGEWPDPQVRGQTPVAAE